MTPFARCSGVSEARNCLRRASHFHAGCATAATSLATLTETHDSPQANDERQLKFHNASVLHWEQNPDFTLGGSLPHAITKNDATVPAS